MKNIHLALQALAREKTQAMVKSAVGSRQIGQWVGEALNQQLSEAFNTQLEKERDEFLGSQPYERQEKPRYRNGFKQIFVPGFLGRLELRKPVLRKGKGFVSETLKALRDGSQALMGYLGMNFWLKGASTRSVAAGMNEAFGTKWSASHISEMTNALEPTLREWEKRPLPGGDPIPVSGCALPDNQASRGWCETGVAGGYRGGWEPETTFSRVLSGRQGE